MSSVRLRLDIGPDPPGRDAHRRPSPRDAAASDGTAGPRIDRDGDDDDARPPRTIVEWDVDCVDDDGTTTVARAVRDGIETRCLGGRLLEFLEIRGPRDRRRARCGLYALVYPDGHVTVVRPRWSSRPSSLSDDALRDDGGTTDEQRADDRCLVALGVQISLLGGGPAAAAGEGMIVAPDAPVGSLVRDRPPNDAGNAACGQEKRRKLDSRQNRCIDLKITTKLLHGDMRGSCWTKPNKVNILLCEEHWRERGKLLQWTLCTSKASSTTNESFVGTNRPSSGITIHGGGERHHPALKSFLVRDFLGEDRFLIAAACLVPTSLVLGGLDAFDGVQLSVDKPSFCQVRSLNLERPAVLRQYFGLDVDEDDATTTTRDGREDVVRRSCYGVGSGACSVGIHPE